MCDESRFDDKSPTKHALHNFLVRSWYVVGKRAVCFHLMSHIV